MNYDQLRPWAHNRKSLRSSILNLEGEEAPSLSHSNLSLTELHDRDDILAARVSPIWNTIKGHDDKELSDAIITLLQRLRNTPTQEDSILLYQLFFTSWFTHFGTWRTLEAALGETDLLESDFIYHYFLFWVEEAPDIDPIDSALFILARCQRKVPMEVLRDLGRHHLLVSAVASTIRYHYNADEDALIDLAKLHGYGSRVVVLSNLQTVRNETNKHWLLTEGYESGADYHPCAYYAAVHGDLLGRLREASSVTPEMLTHYGRCLALMCETVGGSPNWVSIDDYQKAPEAITLFFDHVERMALVTPMHRELSDILYYLVEKTGSDYTSLIWDETLLAGLQQRGRRFFLPPWMPEEETLTWLWWERPDPTIEDLKDGDLSVFHDVLESVKDFGSTDELLALVSWATEFLGLNAEPQLREDRKKYLLSERMPGVCTGGIAGLTDPHLSSVYGQILLQTIQALKGKAPMGKALFKAALETDYPHLPMIAAETLEGWPDDAISDEMQKSIQHLQHHNARKDIT